MSQKQPDITPVILAGGQGSRLRPLTGPGRPKPSLKLFSNYTLLQETLLRVKAFSPPVIILHNVFKGEAFNQCQDEAVGVEPRSIICEPLGRSTAAAIALAAFALQGSDTVMAVMPSDHYIADDAVLRATIEEAASRDGLCQIGVRPRRADPRYGYIEAQNGTVRRFIEKPDAAYAAQLIAAGNVFWNTGLFTCRPGFYLRALKTHAPEIYNACKLAFERGTQDGVFLHPAAEFYAQSPALAVDYAVMENIKGAHLVELKTRWSDVGTWPSLLKTVTQRRILARCA